MLSYFDFFPDKRANECRTVTFISPDDDIGIPSGTYVFLESFCIDLNCDCQRVLVKVLYIRDESSKPRDVANIGYTWNDKKDKSLRNRTGIESNPFLDPMNPQSRIATHLLIYWQAMVRHDGNYADRLERHYHELRRAYSSSKKDHPIDGDQRAPTPIDRKKRAKRLIAAMNHKTR